MIDTHTLKQKGIEPSKLVECPYCASTVVTGSRQSLAFDSPPLIQIRTYQCLACINTFEFAYSDDMGYGKLIWQV